MIKFLRGWVGSALWRDVYCSSSVCFVTIAPAKKKGSEAIVKPKAKAKGKAKAKAAATVAAIEVVSDVVVHCLLGGFRI